MQFKLYLEKTNINYSFSSLQFSLPAHLARRIVHWGKTHISENQLFVQDNKFGREDDIHLTVLYGIHAKEPFRIKNLLRSQKPFDIQLDNVSMFTTDDRFDVVKIGVKSPELMALNKKIRENIPYSSKHKTYSPHVTIAYVKKNSCKDLVGKPFADVIPVNSLIFSSKIGTKTKIPLNNSNYLHEAYFGYGLS